jgi:hypothetical protein
VPADAVAERVLAGAAEDADVDPAHLEQEGVSSLRDVALPHGEVSWAIEPVGNYQAAGGSTHRESSGIGPVGRFGSSFQTLSSYTPGPAESPGVDGPPHAVSNSATAGGAPATV